MVAPLASPESRERLGVFGGTFDPVHVAHLAAASEARYRLALDRVLVVVAADPWQKRGQVVASAEDRFAMVEAAVEGVEGFDASRIEIDRDGPTYTIDTLHALASPNRELFLLIGSDVATRLHTWTRVEEIRDLATLAIVGRGDDERAEPTLSGWNVAHVSIPRLDVSSTDLRRRVGTGEPIDFLMPPAAVHVLRARRLYTGPDAGG